MSAGDCSVQCGPAGHAHVLAGPPFHLGVRNVRTALQTVLGSFGLAPEDPVKQAQVIQMMQEHSLALGPGDFAGHGSPAPSETAVGEAGPAMLPAQSAHGPVCCFLSPPPSSSAGNAAC